jgi:hypothetical protein
MSDMDRGEIFFCDIGHDPRYSKSRVFDRQTVCARLSGASGELPMS